MSEVKMYDGHGEPCIAQYAYFVKKSDYDAAQSELAALREELTGLQSSCAIDRRHLDRMIDHSDDLQQRLTAAEQRNAELTGVLRDLVNGKGLSLVTIKELIDAALKPTESGASE